MLERSHMLFSLRAWLPSHPLLPQPSLSLPSFNQRFKLPSWSNLNSTATGPACFSICLRCPFMLSNYMQDSSGSRGSPCLWLVPPQHLVFSGAEAHSLSLLGPMSPQCPSQGSWLQLGALHELGCLPAGPLWSWLGRESCQGLACITVVREAASTHYRDPDFHVHKWRCLMNLLPPLFALWNCLNWASKKRGKDLIVTGALGLPVTMALGHYHLSKSLFLIWKMDMKEITLSHRIFVRIKWNHGCEDFGKHTSD